MPPFKVNAVLILIFKIRLCLNLVMYAFRGSNFNEGENISTPFLKNSVTNYELMHYYSIIFGVCVRLSSYGQARNC